MVYTPKNKETDLNTKNDNDSYDICIIGSGPGGLACLSCIQEDYSIDMLSDTQIRRASKFIRQNKQSKRICVVDPNPTWLYQWEQNFQTLDISFLRSPAVAHCSYFDKHALVAYAVSEGREKELYESGISDIRSLQGTELPQIGSWKLPSNKLFIDFSRNLAKSLPHDYKQGKVADITKKCDGSDEFHIDLDLTSSDENSKSISAKYVILATGASGKPIIPKSLQRQYTSTSKIYQWQELDKVISKLNCSNNEEAKQVLVLGGGLTAVQSAHKLVRSGHRVLLCSRRNLVERHLDIPVKWFDYREANLHQSQFYHEPSGVRVKALKQARGGGTVPPLYMDITRDMEKKGLITRVIGDVDIISNNGEVPVPEDDTAPLIIQNNETGKLFEVSAIVCACGLQPDCLSNPLINNINKRWPIKMQDGFPLVTERCRWNDTNLFVVGGVASLSVGPDAGNIMGISRAAETVANALDSKLWIRDEDSNVLKNPFDIFGESDTESETEDDED